MIWKTEENFQISSSMVNHKNVENPEKSLKTRDSLKTYRCKSFESLGDTSENIQHPKIPNVHTTVQQHQIK